MTTVFSTSLGNSLNGRIGHKLGHLLFFNKQILTQEHSDHNCEYNELILEQIYCTLYKYNTYAVRQINNKNDITDTEWPFRCWYAIKYSFTCHPLIYMTNGDQKK